MPEPDDDSAAQSSAEVIDLGDQEVLLPGADQPELEEVIKREFNLKWKDQMPWIIWEAKHDIVTCKICIEAHIQSTENSVWTTGMSCPTKDGWKKFTFTQHEKSEMHKEALKAEHLDQLMRLKRAGESAEEFLAFKLCLVAVVVVLVLTPYESCECDRAASHDKNFVPGYPFIYYPGTRITR
uniref:Uncharacterized protein n=1 Tax=Romanomermis culicivorax TaxID=13658 RepID=A0A915K7Z0_ROMCU